MLKPGLQQTKLLPRVLWNVESLRKWAPQFGARLKLIGIPSHFLLAGPNGRASRLFVSFVVQRWAIAAFRGYLRHVQGTVKFPSASKTFRPPCQSFNRRRSQTSTDGCATNAFIVRQTHEILAGFYGGKVSATTMSSNGFFRAARSIYVRQQL